MAIEIIKLLGAVLETAPRFLIFSMAVGADYSFELISIEIYAPQFIGHNKLFLGSVFKVQLSEKAKKICSIFLMVLTFT